MRIVTWNCCRGSATAKLALLATLNPTVAVVQECSRFEDAGGSRLWSGDNARQGIGVICAAPYSVERLPQRDVPRYVVPFHVGGPQSFLLFAVWAKAHPVHPYVQGVIRAVEAYRDLITAYPTVLVGDFNSNSIWNRKRPGARDHGALVNILGDLGIVSAYHAFHAEEQGSESRPTFYFRWQRKPTYHIDYCFIPRSWLSSVQAVEVGTYAGWAKASDHRPVAVDLALPGTA